jgi:hypothetical protein
MSSQPPRLRPPDPHREFRSLPAGLSETRASNKLTHINITFEHPNQQTARVALTA